MIRNWVFVGFQVSRNLKNNIVMKCFTNVNKKQTVGSGFQKKRDKLPSIMVSRFYLILFGCRG